jgi:hypothetical protein
MARRFRVVVEFATGTGSGDATILPFVHRAESERVVSARVGGDFA